MEIDKKYKRIRNSGYALMGAKWVSILSPFIAIGIANYDEYFTEYNGVKMSIGCVLDAARSRTARPRLPRFALHPSPRS